MRKKIVLCFVASVGLVGLSSFILPKTPKDNLVSSISDKTKACTNTHRKLPSYITAVNKSSSYINNWRVSIGSYSEFDAGIYPATEIFYPLNGEFGTASFTVSFQKPHGIKNIGITDGDYISVSQQVNAENGTGVCYHTVTTTIPSTSNGVSMRVYDN